MQMTAHFSPCRQWRYSLTRTWDQGKPACAFVGLNPSTADETTNDPTVTRCINYAKAWDYGGLVMLNLFAFRATDPRGMKAAADPVGPETDRWLLHHYRQCPVTVAAWGVHGAYQARAEAVLKLLAAPVWCLGITKDGWPKHPLYLKRDLRPMAFDWRGR